MKNRFQHGLPVVVALLALAPGWANAAILTRVDEILHSEQALREGA